jgi:hypothetical protein
VRAASIVFVADELDQVRVRHNPLVYFDCERLCVNRRVFKRNHNFQIPVVDAAEAFGHLSSVGKSTAVYIKPYVISKPSGFHYEGIAVPLSHAIAIPPGLHVGGKRSAVRENRRIPP